ncbi:hypothetical protein F4553_003879 [Allocatelliglobosispora scoriae]|uniref:Uncharacterized protein n=1 Tax=Allocatelliglobosispora scoriae TaxID=643052 RepID=A0A841BUR0_9ACTN|nr:hypothetical protein [Allocatelliglobosispora scoriae]MBB5870500.1 hypothetical protein [Allocatelliglobosispora scoriae]
MPMMERPEGGQTRLLKLILTGLIGTVLLVLCGSGVWGILQDERKGSSAAAAPTAPPTELPVDISSREVDEKPLTVAEVFPTKEIVIDKASPPYRLIATQANADCRVAADGQLKGMLVTAGCSQVVRATLKSPTNDYLVTGGIFNMETADSASEAYAQVKTVVDGGKGRFKGYVSSAVTKPLALSSTHLGWDYQGHFLVYCVIARVDGKEFAEGDPFAKQILYDMIEVHLLGSVVKNRATIKVDPSDPVEPSP